MVMCEQKSLTGRAHLDYNIPSLVSIRTIQITDITICSQYSIPWVHKHWTHLAIVLLFQSLALDKKPTTRSSHSMSSLGRLHSFIISTCFLFSSRSFSLSWKHKISLSHWNIGLLKHGHQKKKNTPLKLNWLKLKLKHNIILQQDSCSDSSCVILDKTVPIPNFLCENVQTSSWNDFDRLHIQPTLPLILPPFSREEMASCKTKRKKKQKN